MGLEQRVKVMLVNALLAAVSLGWWPTLTLSIYLRISRSLPSVSPLLDSHML